MSALEAAYTALDALIAADTGAGGLKQGTTGAAWVYGVFRYGDQRRTMSWPNIVIQLDEDSQSPMGAVETSRIGIRFIIETDRDAANSFTKQNAVESRLRVLVRRATLAQQTVGEKTWTFSPPERLGAGQQIPGGKVNQLACAYQLTARGA